MSVGISTARSLFLSLVIDLATVIFTGKMAKESIPSASFEEEFFDVAISESLRDGGFSS